MSRAFAAPRDVVFRVWTECEHLSHWWGPKGVAVFSCKNDLRPGGVMHYGMRTPDGQEIWGRWVYREIAAPARLVFINSFSDPEGGLTRHPGAAEWPLQLLTTIAFDEQDGGTLVTVRWSPYDASDLERATFDAGHDSMRGGWGGTFDQLTEYLAKK
ncbi:MAG TPA: SRPBCC domain-containing protein [Thermoanaerobaculia bacterium]